MSCWGDQNDSRCSKIGREAGKEQNLVVVPVSFFLKACSRLIVGHLFNRFKLP